MKSWLLQQNIHADKKKIDNNSFPVLKKILNFKQYYLT